MEIWVWVEYLVYYKTKAACSVNRENIRENGSKECGNQLLIYYLTSQSHSYHFIKRNDTYKGIRPKYKDDQVCNDRNKNKKGVMLVRERTIGGRQREE